MTINRPETASYPQLKALWRQAFGDTGAFIDGFFRTGFSPERCRCVMQDGKVAAALYWFDCTAGQEKWAYIYAVATEVAHRGKGICAALMDDTHRHLQKDGYAGAVLVPAKCGLWDYYAKLGYTAFGGIRNYTETATAAPVPVEKRSAGAYTRIRRDYLPAGSLCQAQALPFYETWGGFYEGEDFLFAAAMDGETLYMQEFFGNPEKLPGILTALGAKAGKIRIVGGETPCGMYYLLSSRATAPTYLGFALD